MAVGEHYVITLNAFNDVSTEDVANVFCYEQTLGTGGSVEIFNAFQTLVLPKIAAILSFKWIGTSIDCYSLEDPTDYYSNIISTVGVLGGDMMPPFVAATFRLIRTSRAFNNGRKAFGPLPEDQITNGRAISGYVGNLDTLAGALQDPLTEITTSSTWLPVIWRRPGTYASGVVAPPGDFNRVGAVAFSDISTQSTRKFNRGS